MIKKFITKQNKGFDWIDVEAPAPGEIAGLAAELGLVEQSVEDALQPDHLPKYERLKNYEFLILRRYAVDRESDADTVQELTNKVAIFISERFILTVHRYPWAKLNDIAADFESDEPDKPGHVLQEIVKEVLLSFNEPSRKLSKNIDYFEEHIFLKNRKTPLLKSLYFHKRKVDVIRRILALSDDIIDHIDPQEKSNVYTRDIRDLYIKQQNEFDSLAENTNHLLDIYFNISSQRTNETIRVLTIFSVFFMPLTFIVGVYGMNFKHMPELDEKWGYPGVLIFMLLVIIFIFIWFKKRKWL